MFRLLFWRKVKAHREIMPKRIPRAKYDIVKIDVWCSPFLSESKYDEGNNKADKISVPC